MDRRYSQARFYNGTPASRSSSDQADALVRRSLGAARRINSSAQSYGGSTGGASSAAGYSAGPSVSAARGTELSDARQIYKTYGSGALGSGALGGRATIAEIKGFRTPATQQQGAAQ